MAGWRPSTGFLLLIAAGILWGTIAPSVQGVFERSDLTTPETTWLRFVAATPFILVVGWRALGGRLLRLPATTLALSAVLGVLIFLFQLFYFYGIREIGVTATTLVTVCSIPVFTAAFSTVALGERHGAVMLVSLGLAIGGTGLLIAGKPEGGSGDGSLVLGTMFCLLTAAGTTAYGLIGRSVGRSADPLSTLSVAFLCGTVVFSPVALAGGIPLDVSPGTWLLLAYLGVVTQGVAYLLFQRGLETETATTASVVTLVDPLVAALLAWFLFDERLSAMSWGGAVLLFGALGLLTVGAARPSGSTAPAAPAA